MTLYSHIKLGFYLLRDIPTDADQTYIGQHYDWISFSQVPNHNLTAMLTANPNIKVYYYISGTGIYRWTTVPTTETSGTRGPRIANYMAWLEANGKSLENSYWHYQNDKTFTNTDGYNPSTAIMLSGYSAGFVPGWGAGTAESQADSRVPGPHNFVSAGPVSGNLAITNIVATGGTATVTTSASVLRPGDRVTISGTTNFNTTTGVDILTKPDSTHFTYAKEGELGAEVSGTVTMQTVVSHLANYENTEYSDWLISDMDNVCKDSVGNILEGYYFDSINNQISHRLVTDFTKVAECIADGGTGDTAAWLRGKVMPWLDRIRTGTATFLLGTGKTPLVAVNGDHIDYVGDITSAQHEMYESAGTGPDTAIIEAGLMVNILEQPTAEPKLKHIYDNMVNAGKSFIFEMMDYCVIPYAEIPNNPGVPIISWTNYSGFIWWTSDITNKIPCAQIQVGSSNATTVVTSLALLNSAGKIYLDTDTGRLYVWFPSNTDPTGKTIYMNGGEKSRHFSLGLYYCFGRYGEQGYYYPWYNSTIYNQIPSDTNWITRLPSVVYDIGQPTTGGVDYNNATGNDLWGNPRSGIGASDRAYVFWQGNGTTGEAGKWTSDWGSTLSVSHKVYARKFDNGYAFFRMRYQYSGTPTVSNGCYTQPVTFILPFSGKILRGNNTVGQEVDQITIRQGEGIIFITGTEPPFTDNAFIGSAGGVTIR